MGKGDRKTKRGKIWNGSFGVSRKRVNHKAYVSVGSAAPEQEKEAKTEAPKVKSPVKKRARKRVAKSEK